MQNELLNRVAVVTGGSHGIGKAIAVLLASHGAKVFVGDYKLSPSNEEVFSRLGISQTLCDVRDSESIREWIDSILLQSHGIDILVNNAGIVLVKSIPETSEEEWDAVLDTNFKSAFLLSRLVIPSMKARGGGAIVNIASNAGLLPRAHDPAYSTSKGALIAFTKSLALCHADDRIRVNAVCPGPVSETQIINHALDLAADRQSFSRQIIDASPIARACGRMITPFEVAQAVFYLVSDAAQMVTGTSIAIDGGKSLGVPPTRMT
jgi:NAD(P)-dependent dehydrogenase (short-subunit alcohol dehydrogenase family)